MTNSAWKIYYALSAAALVFLPFRWQWAAGWLLGAFISYVIYRRTERFAASVLRMKTSTSAYANFAGNYLMMAVVLIVCAVFPRYLNILACAIGLTTVKLAIILNALLIEKGR